MARARIVYNVRGFRELRTAPETKALCADIADRVAEAAGEGFVAVDREQPRNRARSAVVAATPEAVARNSRENTLLKALEAGRG